METKNFNQDQQIFLAELKDQLEELIELFFQMGLNLELEITKIPDNEDKH